jgi:hypothetical protein
MVHAQLRPLVCDEFGAAFKQPAHCQKKVRTLCSESHGGAIASALRVFGKKYNLKQHQRYVHVVNIEARMMTERDINMYRRFQNDDIAKVVIGKRLSSGRFYRSILELTASSALIWISGTIKMPIR